MLVDYSVWDRSGDVMSKKKWRPKALPGLKINGIYFHAILIGREHDAVSWATRLVVGKEIFSQTHDVTKVNQIDDNPINQRTAMAYAALMAIRTIPSWWNGKVFCHDFNIRKFFVVRNPTLLSDVSFDLANGIITDIRRIKKFSEGGDSGSNLEACVMICQAQLDLRRKT